MKTGKRLLTLKIFLLVNKIKQKLKIKCGAFSICLLLLQVLISFPLYLSTFTITNFSSNLFMWSHMSVNELYLLISSRIFS